MIFFFFFLWIHEHLPNKFKPPGDGLALLTFSGPPRSGPQITVYKTQKTVQ